MAVVVEDPILESLLTRCGFPSGLVHLSSVSFLPGEVRIRDPETGVLVRFDQLVLKHVIYFFIF